jgi:hypothetical protein
LWAITCDLSRSPFCSVGSMVTRKSEASLHSDVIWQTMIEAYSAGSASVWMMTAGRGDRHDVDASHCASNSVTQKHAAADDQVGLHSTLKYVGR